MNFLIIKIRNWYGKFERPISSISLIGGFVFDAIALKRIDLFWENFWIIVHLVVVAICIALINIQEDKAIDPKDPQKMNFWLINILQFFFGGLLSAYLVFYFRSTTLAVTWPFLLILSIAFIANESLKEHYARLTFQISLFFLSLFACAIFIVPIIFHRIGPDIFLISGLTSLVVLFTFLIGLSFFAKEKFKQNKKILALSILTIFFSINILYFLNLIPPIPLSLKDGGIYHSLNRDDSGNYIVQYENTGWLDYFSMHENIHLPPGKPIYAYSAIFSPTTFNTDIVHEWQRYDKNTKTWITISEINLSVIGGRDGGYRTYSMKTEILPGKWRVNVKTFTRQIIGRLRFNVTETIDTKQILKTGIK